VILLSALVLGLIVGWGWAQWQKEVYRAPELKHLWLVPVAILPQLAAVYLPSASRAISGGLAAAALPVSLAVFLAFVWLNRRLAGMPVLLAGLALNLLVISSNNGWMPISPQTASEVAAPGEPMPAAGSRFAAKDIVLRPEEMHLGLLADRFVLPSWIPYRAAFSLGDMLIAAGVFWLLARPHAA
jgi:uncharacterized protein DUF5317